MCVYIYMYICVSIFIHAFGVSVCFWVLGFNTGFRVYGVAKPYKP